MKILCHLVDVGGTHVKVRDTGHKKRVEFPSGLKMTAKKMVAAVRKIIPGWKYDVITIGYPGPVLHGHIVSEPHNLGHGWVTFNFKKAFGCPVKIINDAAMQALGSYEGRRMLFLGLGTGLGSAMIVDGMLRLDGDSRICLTKRAALTKTMWGWLDSKTRKKEMATPRQ